MLSSDLVLGVRLARGEGCDQRGVNVNGSFGLEQSHQEVGKIEADFTAIGSLEVHEGLDGGVDGLLHEVLVDASENKVEEASEGVHSSFELLDFVNELALVVNIKV